MKIKRKVFVLDTKNNIKYLLEITWSSSHIEVLGTSIGSMNSINDKWRKQLQKFNEESERLRAINSS